MALNAQALARHRQAAQVRTLEQQGFARPATPDWANRTRTILQTAQKAGGDAQQLRMENTALGKTLNSALESDQERVAAQLRARLAEINALKTKMTAQYRMLEADAKELQFNQDRARDAAHNMGAPMRLSERRLVIRSQKPAHEDLNDHTRQTLQNQVATLQNGRTQLFAAIQESKLLIDRIRQHAVMMSDDIENKATAIRVDEQCLRLGNRGSPTELTESAMNATATEPGLQDPTGLTNPSLVSVDRWRKDTNQLLGTAQTLRGQAHKLIDRLTTLLSQSEAQTRIPQNESNTALRRRIDLTAAMHCRLSQQAQRVASTLNNLAIERELLLSSLKDNRARLALIRDQLSIRKSRPGIEAVYDPAEAALLSELRNVKNGITTLENKLNDVIAEEARLKRISEIVHSDMTDKNASLELDRQALALDINDHPSLLSSLSAHSTHSNIFASTPTPLRGAASSSASAHHRRRRGDIPLGASSSNGPLVGHGEKRPPSTASNYGPSIEQLSKLKEMAQNTLTVSGTGLTGAAGAEGKA